MLLDAHFSSAYNWLQGHNLAGIVAWVVSFAYGFLAMLNYGRIQSRRQTGKTWYSMSRGESIFGSENKTRDILIGIFAVVFLGIVSPVLGFFFFASQFASYYLAAKTQNSFYNRYLDIQDAKIENQFMQRCLDRGEPPRNTDGLFCPLPNAITGENRTRVARVVATTQIAPGSPGAAQGTPQPQFSAGPQNDPNTISMLRSQAGEMIPAVQAGMKMVWQPIPFIAKIVSSKNFVRFAVVALVVAGILYAGSAVLHAIKSHGNQPEVASVAANESAAPAATVPGVNPSSVSIAAANSKASQDREKTLFLLKGALSNAIQDVSEFTTNFNEQMVNLALEIGDAPQARQNSLKREYNELLPGWNKNLKEQKDTLNFLQTNLTASVMSPQSDPQVVRQKIEKIISDMNLSLQEIADNVKALHTKINPTPKQ